MKQPLTESTPSLAQDSQNLTDRSAEYAVYKPNSRGSGGVVRFGLNRSKGAVFVDAATQVGEKQFDWENKITMKWGLSDLGQIMACLQGRQAQAKLFHQSENANSACDLIPSNDPERAPYFLSISRQDTVQQSLKKVSIPMTHGEAAVLEAALRGAVTQILRW